MRINGPATLHTVTPSDLNPAAKGPSNKAFGQWSVGNTTFPGALQTGPRTQAALHGHEPADQEFAAELARNHASSRG